MLKLVTPQLADGQRAFEKHKAELDALPVDDLEPVRVDLQAVAAIAHSVATRDKTSDRIQGFERLARVDLYDVGAIDRLATLSLAAWFVRQRQLAKTAIASTAQVSEPVLREAQERRGRMLSVLEYWMATRPRSPRSSLQSALAVAIRIWPTISMHSRICINAPRCAR